MRSSVVVGALGAGAVCGSGPLAAGTAAGTGFAFVAAWTGTTNARVAMTHAAATAIAKSVRRDWTDADLCMFILLSSRSGCGGERRGAACRHETRGHEQPDEPAESHHEHAAHDRVGACREQRVHAVDDADHRDRDRA